jgi:hypothetical protein
VRETFRSGENEVAAEDGLDHEHRGLVARAAHRRAVEVDDAVPAATRDGQIEKLWAP